MVMVCDRMHWDYQTYLKQPAWFIEMLVIKWEIESKRKD